ncbi:hypothetical protein KSC_028720 [Ktedonobacter sp. SOSP1-52]|nr:hypothetical protein KSC_028720 [Ktedonobacter sp. SOSP1-52]
MYVFLSSSSGVGATYESYGALSCCVESMVWLFAGVCVANGGADSGTFISSHLIGRSTGARDIFERCYDEAIG